MSIKHLYEDERPSLLIDFANSKTLDPRITFTRNSTATYVDEQGVIKTAAAGEARFDHDPATGECLGLLIEESRTNSVSTSVDYSGFAIWGTASVTASSGTAPDGTNTATLVAPTGSGGRTSIYKPLGFGSGTEATVSIYAKPSGKSWVWLLGPGSGVYAYFNVSTGVTGTVDSSITNTTIEPAGNGWYRISVTRTPTSNYQINFGVSDGDNSVACAVNGSDGILFWGAQLEQGAFPTSYIPTSGSTVARNADEAEITGTNFSNWYNQSEGTFVISSYHIGGNNNEIRAGKVGGHWYNEVAFGDSPNYNFYINSNASGSTQSTVRFLGFTRPTNQIYKIAGAYKANNFGFALDGVSGTPNISTGLAPVGINYLQFGVTTVYPNVQQTGYFLNIAYYNTRLPDTTLEALTK